MPYVTLKNSQGYILLNGDVDESDWPEELVVKKLYGDGALIYYNNGENVNPMIITVYYEDSVCKCTKVIASGLIFEIKGEKE